MPTHPPSAREEIATLRRLMRLLRRAIALGQVDPLKGTRLVNQTTIALAALLRTQHHIAPSEEDTRRQEEFDRLCDALGWPRDDS